MRGISFWFVATSVLYVIIGMVWGIVMSASGDHMLAPAHAHLNLLGWVTMALFGIYYHLVPVAGERMLARIHFVVAAVGVLVLVPGIVMAMQGNGEALAKLGSMLSLLSMVIFFYTVIRNRVA